MAGMEQLAAALAGIRLLKDAPLSACTTLRLGGPADLLAEPVSAEELRRCLTAAREADVPVTVIGRGSNLLIRDGGRSEKTEFFHTLHIS